MIDLTDFQGKSEFQSKSQREEPPSLHIHAESSLSEDQRKVFRAVLEGKNVFFTGSAGTGKSTLMNFLIEFLPKHTTYVTASTGMAAINIGGITLHKFAGIGIGEGQKMELLRRANTGQSRTRWKNAKIILIDEISMISAELFDSLDYIAKAIRRDPLPFGGIQLICCGDFFQLPPVAKQSDTAEARFCFESQAWKDGIKAQFELKKIYRQTNQNFIDILNQIRHGNCNDQAQAALKGCINRTFSGSEIDPVCLFSLNKAVDEMNNRRLKELNDIGAKFFAKDQPPNYPQLQHCKADKELFLKVGAQVILLTNLDVKRGLASGLQGKIIKFDKTKKGFPRVKFLNGQVETIGPHKWSIMVEGKEVASRKQIPLKLAWALSIHKCQGQTLSLVEINLKNVFEHGQAYVALSRVTDISGLRLTNFDPKVIHADPKVLEFYQSFDGYESPTKPKKRMLSLDSENSPPNQKKQRKIETLLPQSENEDSPTFGSTKQATPKPKYEFYSDTNASTKRQKTKHHLTGPNDDELFEDITKPSPKHIPSWKNTKSQFKTNFSDSEEDSVFDLFQTTNTDVPSRSVHKELQKSMSSSTEDDQLFKSTTKTQKELKKIPKKNGTRGHSNELGFSIERNPKLATTTHDEFQPSSTTPVKVLKDFVFLSSTQRINVLDLLLSDKKDSEKKPKRSLISDLFGDSSSEQELNEEPLEEPKPTKKEPAEEPIKAPKVQQTLNDNSSPSERHGSSLETLTMLLSNAKSEDEAPDPDFGDILDEDFTSGSSTKKKTEHDDFFDSEELKIKKEPSGFISSSKFKASQPKPKQKDIIDLIQDDEMEDVTRKILEEEMREKEAKRYENNSNKPSKRFYKSAKFDDDDFFGEFNTKQKSTDRLPQPKENQDSPKGFGQKKGLAVPLLDSDEDFDITPIKKTPTQLGENRKPASQPKTSPDFQNEIINIEDIELPCSQTKCQDCIDLKGFMASKESVKKFEVSNDRRKHLHTVIGIYNQKQAQLLNLHLTHESEGTGSNRYLVVRKKAPPKAIKTNVVSVSPSKKTTPNTTPNTTPKSTPKSTSKSTPVFQKSAPPNQLAAQDDDDDEGFFPSNPKPPPLTMAYELFESIAENDSLQKNKAMPKIDLSTRTTQQKPPKKAVKIDIFGSPPPSPPPSSKKTDQRPDEHLGFKMLPKKMEPANLKTVLPKAEAKPKPKDCTVYTPGRCTTLGQARSCLPTRHTWAHITPKWPINLNMSLRATCSFFAITGLIFAIQAVSPLSVIWVCFVLFNWSSVTFDTAWAAPLLALVTLWALLETCFFPYHLLTHRRLQQRNGQSCHVARTRQERKKLLENCLSAAMRAEGCASKESLFREMVQKWFFGVEFEEIKRDNMYSWVAWAFFDKDLAELQGEKDELDELLLTLEQTMGYTFPPGNNPNAKSIRLNIDPVYVESRPLAYYAVIWAVRWLGHLAITFLGFELKRQQIGKQQLSYYYRPGWDQKPCCPKPIVFTHGIGIGLTNYLTVLPRFSPNVPIYLLDLPHVSMVLGAENVMGPGDTVKALSEVLKRDGISSACFVGHSYGTAVTSWVVRNAPSLVSSVVLIDPIVFLLSEPTVVHSFIHRKPSNTMELLIHFFVSKELYISHTLSRSHSILFVEDLPQKLNKNVIILSGHDKIVPVLKVHSYLENVSPRTTELLWFDKVDHGELFFSNQSDIIISKIHESCGDAKFGTVA